jgi:hypothetical protein
MSGPGFDPPDLCSIRGAAEQEELAGAVRGGFTVDGYPPSDDDPPGDTRALNAAYQALAVTSQPMRRVQAVGQSERAGTAMAAATAARHYALNLIRDIPPAVAPDADTAALLDRGCQNLQASLTSLQSAVADPHGTTWTRSASLFDLVEQRLAAPGSNGRKAHLALHDLRLIDGALAELAGALGMDITSYDTGPAGAPSAGPPDSAA